MSNVSQRKTLWRAWPLLGIFIWEWQVWRKNRMQPCYRLTSLDDSAIPPYPIDMWPLLAFPDGPLDNDGVLYTSATEMVPASYHPTNIAQYGLASWNAYLATKDEQHKQAFLAQASWLVTHEMRLADDAGGWPLPFPNDDFHAPGPWLSALTQGVSISLLIRAHQLTYDDTFLQVARRAVHTFERDILDGGVSATIGDDGIFFEEVAVYPAAHILNGYILSLFGLYDYVALTHDRCIAALIQRSLTTLHTLIDEFDLGYGSRYDLLIQSPTSRFYHSLHVLLLEALAHYSDCKHYTTLAVQWARYQHGLKAFKNHFMARIGRYQLAIRHTLFGVHSIKEQATPTHIYIPMTAEEKENRPDSIARIGLVMANDWQIFPLKFSFFSGWYKLISLLRYDHTYPLLLSQEITLSSTFSTIIASMAGIRVVWVDNETVVSLYNHKYRDVHMKTCTSTAWYLPFLSRLQSAGHTLLGRILTRITTHYADHIFVASEDAKAIYKRQLGVHPSRISRFPIVIDVDQYVPLEQARRMQLRADYGIEDDAIVITIISSQLQAQDVDTTLQGIDQMLSTLSPALCKHVHILIIGNSSLYTHIENAIRKYESAPFRTTWHETPLENSSSLLGITDLFLSTPVSDSMEMILKAMSSGCTVITLQKTKAIAQLIADERGVVLPAFSAHALGTVFTHLIRDISHCRSIGERARMYVVEHHSARTLRRCILQATHYAPDIKCM